MFYLEGSKSSFSNFKSLQFRSNATYITFLFINAFNIPSSILIFLISGLNRQLYYYSIISSSSLDNNSEETYLTCIAA